MFAEITFFSTRLFGIRFFSNQLAKKRRKKKRKKQFPVMVWGFERAQFRAKLFTLTTKITLGDSSDILVRLEILPSLFGTKVLMVNFTNILCDINSLIELSIVFPFASF